MRPMQRPMGAGLLRTTYLFTTDRKVTFYNGPFYNLTFYNVTFYNGPKGASPNKLPMGRRGSIAVGFECLELQGLLPS